MQVSNALVHIFDAQSPPYYDDEGDQMIGCYYQWVDKDENPIGGLIGPYSDSTTAERAAQRAFDRKDF